MVTDHIKATIEYNLKRYRRWKSRLKEIDDILGDVSLGVPSYDDVGGGKSNNISDNVSREVIERDRLKNEFNMLKRKVKSIDNSLDALTDRQLKLIELKYFEGLIRKEILIEMAIEKSTYYTILDECFDVLAEVYGYISTVNGQN